MVKDAEKFAEEDKKRRVRGLVTGGDVVALPVGHD